VIGAAVGTIVLPYRKPPAVPPDEAPGGPDREEVVSYVLLATAGGIPVGGALAHHETFHTEATIGVFMLLAGSLGLLASVRAAWRARRSRRTVRD
jgi:hypothetical protein